MILGFFFLHDFPKSLVGITLTSFGFKWVEINWNELIKFIHLQINISYCSVTDVGLMTLVSFNRLQNMTILHIARLIASGLAAALYACKGLTKVKLHSAFKESIPRALLNQMEAGGCIFHWKNKAVQVKPNFVRIMSSWKQYYSTLIFRCLSCYLVNCMIQLEFWMNFYIWIFLGFNYIIIKICDLLGIMLIYIYIWILDMKYYLKIFYIFLENYFRLFVKFYFIFFGEN